MPKLDYRLMKLKPGFKVVRSEHGAFSAKYMAAFSANIAATDHIHISGRRGFYSSCSLTLAAIGSILKENKDAKIFITIENHAYGNICMYRSYFVPPPFTNGGKLHKPRKHPNLVFPQQLRLYYSNIAHQYFRPIPELENKIIKISNTLGSNPLGVHYRGTDKYRQRLSYHSYCQEITRYIDLYKPSSVFVASDETGIINVLHTFIPNLITLDHIRETSNNRTGIHDRKIDPWRLGIEAVLDAYILSKCHTIMMPGYSNLSNWSAILSPNADIIIVN
jgi:hypothetical protein